MGKSTILRRVAQMDKRFEVIHLASGIMQQLGLPPGSYDELRDASQPAKDKATTEMIHALVERHTHKVRLIDGHYLYAIAGQFSRAVGLWVASLDAYVLVTARTDVIWGRIQADEILRNRDLFAPGAKDSTEQEQLSRFINENAAEFERISKKYQKDHFILTHNDNDVDRAARQLINFCDTLQA